MTWAYEQVTGRLASEDGSIEAAGYSGHGEGVNNPDFQEQHDVGPIPRGTWTIGPAITHPRMGPLCMALTPDETTETFGRSGFFIHGDLPDGLRDASHGCIVLAHATRLALADSDDRRLQVF